VGVVLTLIGAGFQLVGLGLVVGQIRGNRQRLRTFFRAASDMKEGQTLATIGESSMAGNLAYYRLTKLYTALGEDLERDQRPALIGVGLAAGGLILSTLGALVH
jgi:hypothetical protein